MTFAETTNPIDVEKRLSMNEKGFGVMDYP